MYIEIGIKCFTSGILLTEYDYETIAGQIACALYHLKNIDLSGRATKVFISLKVDTSQEFAPDYENNCWLSTFASPLEYLF